MADSVAFPRIFRTDDKPAATTPQTNSNSTTYVYILTGVFGALFIILPLLVRKSPDRGTIRCCIMLTLFCMWIFWVTVYIAQMNPLIGPRMSNNTLAWVAHKWGDSAKKAPASNDES